MSLIFFIETLFEKKDRFLMGIFTFLEQFTYCRKFWNYYVLINVKTLFLFLDAYYYIHNVVIWKQLFEYIFTFLLYDRMKLQIET